MSSILAYKQFHYFPLKKVKYKKTVFNSDQYFVQNRSDFELGSEHFGPWTFLLH